jgi:hypothetical protein
MEARGVTKIPLVTRDIDNSQTWYAVGPNITVEPHEHLLLRFEFDPKRNYSGYFVMEAENAYREYHLPDSGQPGAFGVGESRTSVLSLWNTGSAAQHYKMSVSEEPGNDVPHPGGLFANLYASKLEPSALSVELQSYMPYRARVKASAGETLETFRAYMPGYRATVDGSDVKVTQSRQHLVAVAVPAGTHEVEVRFAGSARLWAAAIVSGMGWICLLAYWALDASRRLRTGFA